MPRLRLRIAPMLLAGAASIGTIEQIRVIRRTLGLGLGEAKALVDRCGSGGETVAIEFPGREPADDVEKALESIESPARVVVEIDQ